MGVKTQMNCHDPYVLTRSEDTRSVSAQSRLIRSVSSWDTLWLVVVVVVVVCSSWEGALTGYNLGLAPNQSDAMLKACQKNFPIGEKNWPCRRIVLVWGPNPASV